MNPPGSRHSARRLAIVVAACAMVLVGCSAASPGRATPVDSATGSAGGDVASVVRALTATGLICTNLEQRTPATHVHEQGKCTVAGEDVLIRLFATPAERDAFLAASGQVVDRLSFDVDAPPRVVGATWIVTTDTVATAKKIQAALGGELK